MRQLICCVVIFVYTLAAGYVVFSDPLIDRAIAKVFFFLIFPAAVSVYCRPKKETN